jgi:hypothetical protein
MYKYGHKQLNNEHAYSLLSIAYKKSFKNLKYFKARVSLKCCWLQIREISFIRKLGTNPATNPPNSSFPSQNHL